MRKLVIGMALASTVIASPALAREGQWYVALEGGTMIVEDPDLNLNTGADTLTANTETGYDFGGIVGYDFGSFRLEVESSFREADISSLSIGSAGLPTLREANTVAGTFDAAGDVNALSFMLNGLFDFGDDDGLQGYVGGGVGVARTEVHAYYEHALLDDSDSGLAWQLLAGIRAPLSDNWDAGLRYRMFTAEDVNLVDVRGRTLDGKLRSHSILGTFTYNFGGEEAPPPPVKPTPRPVIVPPPARPKPPVCNKGPYIVFFEWDQSDITPEAATILNNAVSAYSNCGLASVMLAGHADTSGTKVYNQGLSERRNVSVNEYLTGRGIPADRISGEAFGETQLRVPTEDGVRELQNRRVEVTYGPNAGM